MASTGSVFRTLRALKAGSSEAALLPNSRDARDAKCSTRIELMEVIADCGPITARWWRVNQRWEWLGRVHLKLDKSLGKTGGFSFLVVWSTFGPFHG